MRKAVLFALALIFFSVSVAAQTRTDADTPAHRRWWVSMSLATGFDTNITHDEQQVMAFGVIPSLGFHFRDNPERPSLEVDYEVGIHRYTNTDEFNRVSHSFIAVYRKRLTKRIVSRTTTEISLKGSSEDRDVNNNYIFEQQLQYRFPTNTRIAGFAAYRLKRYPLIEADSNSIDSYVGAKIEQRFGGDRSVELTYRYDHNRTWNPRSNYFRRTYTLEYQTPLSVRRQDWLAVKFRYAPRTYQSRTTRVGRVRVPRHDDRWVFEVDYTRLLRPDLLVGFNYEYEKRTSNDLDKFFTSHAFGLRFTFDKWSLR